MASQFSAFAPSGIRFTSRKPKAEAFYETYKASWGTLFDDNLDSEANTDAYAMAKVFGIAAEMLDRAGNQASPRYVNELISKLEKDYKIIPEPGATIAERRAELIAASASSAGDFTYAIRDAIRLMIGDELLGVVQQPLPDTVGGGGRYPDTYTAATSGPGNFRPLGATFKSISCIGPILPGSTTVTYAHVAGNENTIKTGDVIVIEPDALGRVERVTATSTTETTFTATFANTHPSVFAATTAAIPYWISKKRLLYVVVANTVFSSPKKMAMLHKFLGKTLVHAAQWHIVRSASTSNTGAFTVGSSIIGESTIAGVTY